MNKQLKLNSDGSVKTRGIEWCDYTFNPIAGCFHACQWTMPDGKIANCYAEDVAERVAGHAYPEGFEHHYWKPQLLDEPGKVKTPSRIFVGSMADVMGHWVPDEQIQQVIDQCAKNAHHTFQFLTKNPKRYRQFEFPKNCWLGASTPPDFMWNKPLSHGQRGALLMRTLDHLRNLKVRGNTTWLSAEPLTIDLASYLEGFYTRPVDWIVIGAASDGNKYFPPDEKLVVDVVNWADRTDCAVFFKGNLKSLDWAAKNWLEEFPATAQGMLF